MSHYKNAVSWNYYFDSAAAESASCEVRITDDQIVVSYETDEGHTVYAGSENTAGHYILESESPAGRATLHRLPDSLILEGYWEEGGSKGMWRIQLGEVSDDLTGEDIDATLLGTDDDELELEEPEERFEDEVFPVRFSFPMRKGWDIRFRVPADWTRAEARRFAHYINSLPTSEDA